MSKKPSSGGGKGRPGGGGSGKGGPGKSSGRPAGKGGSYGSSDGRSGGGYQGGGSGGSRGGSSQGGYGSRPSSGGARGGYRAEGGGGGGHAAPGHRSYGDRPSGGAPDRGRGREERGPRAGRGRTDGPPPPNDKLVYGRNPVKELLRAKRRNVHMIHCVQAAVKVPWLEGLPMHVSSAEDLFQISGTNDHQGIVAECDPYPYVELKSFVGKPGVVLVLDEITDPRNVGAIARTAEATGAVGLVLPERRSAHVNATVCKTSAGAIEHLRVAQVVNLSDTLATLKAGGAWTYGAAMGGTPFQDLELAGPVAIVLGGEGKGLRPRVASNCDALISLPMVGNVDSLNVSAAAAVLMYAAMAANA
jgi:23S rRNA (guanosine2251-2'-O)-methyltransferase